MKIIKFFLMLSLCITSGFSQVYTNGVYLKNGKTIEVDKKLHQFTPTNNNEVLYFSNELIAKIYTNSNFTVNIFSQEIINTNNIPEKAKFGDHNFSSTLLDGSVIIVYSGGSPNSSCVLSTTLTDHELSRGVFYFQVSKNNVMVFVLEGSLKSVGERGGRTLTTTSGNAVIAVSNDSHILESKVSLYEDKIKKSVVEKLTDESKNIIALKGNTLFVLIDGKVIGIIIN